MKTTRLTISKNSKILKRNAGIYLNSDILSIRETKLIQKTIETFGFANILIDKTAPNLNNRKYTMTFTDRCDILTRDLKDIDIEDYQILPITTSIQNTIEENEIDIMIFDLEEQKETNFTLQKKIETLTNIETIDFNLGTYTNLSVNDLYKFDQKKILTKRMFSDYAFTKYRLRNIRKVGMFGENENTKRIMKEILNERNVKLFDMKDKDYKTEIGKFLKDGFEKSVFITGLSKETEEKNKEMFNTRIYFAENENLLENKPKIKDYDLVVIPKKNDTETKNFLIEKIFCGKTKSKV